MVKLPAFFGRNKTINLLPKDSFESSTLGIILEWALAFGKWAVIITQLVVMAAFLWRFGLDRKLTNLRREIEQQVAVIKSYEVVEEEFLLAQRRVDFAKEGIARQEEVLSIVTGIQAVTPPDVWFERLSVSPTTVSLTAYAASLSGFGRFLTALQRDPRFVGVNVASIEDGGDKGAQLSFDITLTYKVEQAKKPTKVSQEE